MANPLTYQDMTAREPYHVWETPSAEYVAYCMELSVDRAQAQLDAFAQTRNYDGMTAACTYATSRSPSLQLKPSTA